MPLSLPVLIAAGATDLTPFLVLFAGIAFVVIAIGYLRIHPFISLVIAAVLVGSLSNLFAKTESNPITSAIGETMRQLGNTAGGIAWIIALAAIIGLCLMESGAADRIVRCMIKVFGEERAGYAMLASAFFLSIPVFFDTVFYLIVPLAQALAYRLGRHYVYFIVAVCTGAAITHSLVPPTPGPLLVVESLGLNLGHTIVGGITLGILPAIVGLRLGKALDAKLGIQLRDSGMLHTADLKEITEKDLSELPGFLMAALPVALPVLLIASSSFMGEFSSQESLGLIFTVIEVLGQKHVAMFIGALIAISLLARYRKLDKRSLWKALESPLGTAGTIILITAAGGAFGGMIRQSGIGETITELTEGSGFSFILLAWLVAAVMKVAQGSSTTSMITTSGIMAGILATLSATGASLGFDPFYIFAAIAFGAMFGSWMNDSGFWIVCKMTGFTESETLKTWTLSVSVISLTGLVQLLVLSHVVAYPFGR
ncbi:TRAP transporter large permease subunit [Pelagicoccus sp. NFK12]|uniref:TRAP transporter large permease subunit n=1 Tax=Pelagicoccus enzymogenes TaxID=2773457 RepID=A0A927FFR2_9BACT|nr:SLC13 family permease [Pelagicoccus enzymogenes]MBD5782568.1 TRAP transporter large permease subunit [Pelagicoccus enzymogenes]MDQ8199519.1 SLC13 family permease [Pelagicoccus enzymogenes]